MKLPKHPTMYTWKHEPKPWDYDFEYWTYRAPGMFCMLRNDPPKGWQWVVFDGGGNVLASEYQIASRQNAQRQAVAYITKREQENSP